MIKGKLQEICTFISRGGGLTFVELFTMADLMCAICDSIHNGQKKSVAFVFLSPLDPIVNIYHLVWFGLVNLLVMCRQATHEICGEPST